MRIDGRKPDQARKLAITDNYIAYAEGSVLIEIGNTKVICTATVDEKVPAFKKGSGEGWLTAEYCMIPRATQKRNDRDISKLKLNGRAAEIQRLIGRTLRSVIDLKALGERLITIDCDVIQADGGTRTAAITGGFIAAVRACKWMMDKGIIDKMPVGGFVAATSVGLVNEKAILDLCYEEDSKAAVDMNVAMTDSGKFIEVQATGEQYPFSETQFNEMLALAKTGIEALIAAQKKILGPLAQMISSGNEA